MPNTFERLATESGICPRDASKRWEQLQDARVRWRVLADKNTRSARVSGRVQVVRELFGKNKEEEGARQEAMAEPRGWNGEDGGIGQIETDEKDELNGSSDEV